MRVITAEDIDFNILGDHLVFENMCKDLIREMGFYNVDWQDGSFDRGRDIEAELVVDYKLVGEKMKSGFLNVNCIRVVFLLERLLIKLDGQRLKSRQACYTNF